MRITIDLAEAQPLRELSQVLYELAKQYPSGTAVAGAAILVIETGTETESESLPAETSSVTA